MFTAWNYNCKGKKTKAVLVVYKLVARVYAMCFVHVQITIKLVNSYGPETIMPQFIIIVIVSLP